MKRALIFSISTVVGLLSAPGADKKTTTKYDYVQVQKFEVEQGVDFPPDYQLALVEDLVKQFVKTKKFKQVMRQGEAMPEGKQVLRVTGTVTKYSKGSQAKRYLVGFGAGSTVVVAQVKFHDAATNELLLGRKVDGKVVMGVMGGKSAGATNGVAKEIVKVASSEKLF